MPLPRLCCQLLRQAATGCWGRRYRRERTAATGEGREDAPGVFAGLRSGGAGAKMPFVCPIRSILSCLAAPVNVRLVPEALIRMGVRGRE
jgi:hypothetical protein